MLEAIGWGQKPRGRKFRSFRPDLVFLDDFESEENTNTENLREKVRRFIRRKVMPAIEKQGGQLVLTGTIVHVDSFLNRSYNIYQQMLSTGQPNFWEVMFLQIEDTNGKPIWGKRYSKEWIIRKGIEARAAGDWEGFRQEYYNEPMSDEKRRMKPHVRLFDGNLFWRNGGMEPWMTIKRYLRHNNALPGAIEPRNQFDQITVPVHIYAGLDLGFTNKDESDYTAMILVAVDPDENYYYFHDTSGPMDYGQIEMGLARADSQFRPILWRSETNGAQGLVQAGIQRNRATQNRPPFNIIADAESIGKDARIDRILGPLRKGNVYVHITLTNYLKDMDDWPSPARRDRLDAGEKAIREAMPPPRPPTLNAEGFYDDEEVEVQDDSSWITV